MNHHQPLNKIKYFLRVRLRPPLITSGTHSRAVAPVVPLALSDAMALASKIDPSATQATLSNAIQWSSPWRRTVAKSRKSSAISCTRTLCTSAKK
jgi:hypothetical protein